MDSRMISPHPSAPVTKYTNDCLYMYTCMHTTFVHTHIYIYKDNTHTYIHTYIDIHDIHACMHTYIYIYV